jgi:hypothetical protein
MANNLAKRSSGSQISSQQSNSPFIHDSMLLTVTYTFVATDYIYCSVEHRWSVVEQGVPNVVLPPTFVSTNWMLLSIRTSKICENCVQYKEQPTVLRAVNISPHDNPLQVLRGRGDIAQVATSAVKRMYGHQSTKTSYPPEKYPWCTTVSSILIC